MSCREQTVGVPRERYLACKRKKAAVNTGFVFGSKRGSCFLSGPVATSSLDGQTVLANVVAEKRGKKR